MTNQKKIKTALISIFHKENIEAIIHKLASLEVSFISTGGTKEYIEKLGYTVTAVEELTSFPSMLGGRVKTLHPAVMGGILYRRDHQQDIIETQQYNIPNIDLVIVDLYPFEQTIQQTQNEEEIIEKIDIGGISLIRAAAKNFNDVVIIPSQKEYSTLLTLLNEQDGFFTLEQRRYFAQKAFETSAYYDRMIFSYFAQSPYINIPLSPAKTLRYGENPHQKGWFIGNMNDIFEKIQGQEISYNNLLDIDSGLHLLKEFNEPTLAILKHNNTCGIASDSNPMLAWKKALAGDPVSAFGGVIVCNFDINLELAKEIDNIFFEILVATDFSNEAIEHFNKKQKRILLKLKNWLPTHYTLRSALNGILVEERDLHTEHTGHFNYVTTVKPSEKQIEDLIFANKIVKHTKSNAIVLVKDKQLIGSGIGQTSRVDAVRHAIEKAKAFNFELKGAVLASDAFFPFSDSIEMAHKQGIDAFIQPGGSIRDKDSIDYCNQNNLSMIFTGFRHFKH
ncbi:MAG TPA: bifunctional phosphoribosylaminoimidazolecarboxamide formyltransferase/IMP cyclohydrolase [Bacteroidales bacterium]|nr:bifunctional phosphoribosylaminoimidazolecarboxamide formyltransferase/IMP cyclohydrolase [Bacteroidales bacterium]